jgi:hypothetical protein
MPSIIVRATADERLTERGSLRDSAEAISRPFAKGDAATSHQPAGGAGKTRRRFDEKGTPAEKGSGAFGRDGRRSP